MYGNTEQMAEAIAAELSVQGIKNIVMHNVSKSNPSYIIADIFKYRGLIIGSPTYSNQIYPEIESLLSKILVREVKGRYLGYFGSFCWAGAAVKRMGEFAEKSKFEIVGDPVEIIGLAEKSMTSTCTGVEMFRKLLLPYYKKMIDTLKAKKPDLVMILHSDGAVGTLMPMIKECGFDVFNPVQPRVPLHSPQEVKDKYGDMFAFWGAIDQQYLMPNGTDEELEADIKKRIEILGKGGGYMVAPAHIIQADVKPERVEKFIELCKKYGQIY